MVQLTNRGRAVETLRSPFDPIALDGGLLPVRPLLASDAAAYSRAFAALSPRSRRLRFGGAKPTLAPRELDYLTHIDHHRHEALLVLTPSGERIIAVGRYACSPYDLATADIALAVGDRWQGRGIGRALARRLVMRARNEGMQRLSATVLEENTASLRMLHSAGFRVVDRGSGSVELSLPLTTVRA
jgi:acetyltransferase